MAREEVFVFYIFRMERLERGVGEIHVRGEAGVGCRQAGAKRRKTDGAPVPHSLTYPLRPSPKPRP